MKKVVKILIIILLSILIAFGIAAIIIYNAIREPSVNRKDKKIITEYTINYLDKKYGDNGYKVKSIEYEFQSQYLFDYSNKVGYEVYLESKDGISFSLTIKGTDTNTMSFGSDSFVFSYYFPELDGYATYIKREEMEPKEEFEKNLFEELKNKVDSDIYEVNCDFITFDVPDNFGRIPTLEEIESDVNLYRPLSFEYKTSSIIYNEENYENKINEFIKEKYNEKYTISFSSDKKTIIVSEED